ncbi:MAG TPA: hypothetical protein VMF08_01805 [Candidatus Sulfotelmatobacter sp.]|nr:hypothetical protein [Candidatus Sulfotelmatobacter sp.]
MKKLPGAAFNPGLLALTLYLGFPARGGAGDLLNWKDEHHPIPNSYECPDFFELPVDGNTNNEKWVLIQGSGKYSIGTFDGIEFKEETGRYACDIGPNFYATETWANTETGDGRRILIR